MVILGRMKKAMTFTMSCALSVAMFSTSVLADDAKLTTIETVDSDSKGVNIQLFNYNSRANIGAKGYVSGDGSITQGLLSNTISEDGYPIAKESGKSLKEWFSKDGEGVAKAYLNCNNLFSKEIYGKTGYFVYSSFDNYAELDLSGGSDDVHNFKVYEQLGTPSCENIFYYKRGNFFPFNKLDANSISKNTNLYDKDGKKLKSSDARYNEKLYQLCNPDYYFGMQISTGFDMLKDGQFNGEDMVYEFNGDDDLWVYIDGVMVLDLGGVHDAHTGSINFATGKIVEDTSTQKKDKTNKTTLRQRFIDAGVEEENIKELFGDGDTFKENSEHVLKMYYMERGAGASNCYVKLNLATKPEEEVEIEDDIIPEVSTPEKPTEAPTQAPTEAPTQKPTQKPTEKPTQEPTVEPTQEATQEPTQEPTVEPTEKPTEKPTVKLDDNATPKTSDESNILLIGGIAAASLIVTIVLVIINKKKKF